MTRRQHRFLLMVVPLALALGWAGTARAEDENRALRRCRVNLATCNANLGTCNTNLTQSQGNLATCNANLTSTQANLTSTQASLATCNTSLNQSQANLATCASDLAACQANASAFPATGQTSSFRAGDDGEFQAGATLSYTDNGDGTITDNNTGLEWEKKSDDSSIHDKDTTYTWENAFAVHVAGLNTANFAGFNDWRLPNVKELQSIVNYQFVNPAVSDAFKTPCASGATVLTGSCTAVVFPYWSSTTNAVSPTLAWVVDFHFGIVGIVDKGSTSHVRAVRGGSP